MYIVGIVALLLVPYLCGTLEMMVLRERNAGHLKTYVTGLLSLFAYFLLAILASLKLDLSFERLRLLFLAGPAILAVCGIPCLIVRVKKGLFTIKLSINKDMLWFVPTATALGVVAYILMQPSFFNDNTWEIVSTTLATDTYYEFSSLTGNRLSAGLPIFVKIYVMPMLYAVLCKTFGFDMKFIAGLFMPVLFYVLNLCIMYSISAELFGKTASRKRATYMCTYLIFLLAGTYLPINGVTATVGYGLLREGYSGYGVVYGVLIPFVILLLLKKNYLLACLSSTAVLGLLPLDKFFNLVICSPANFFYLVNYAGKLAALYIMGIAILLFLRIFRSEKHFSAVFFFPAALVSYSVVEISSFVEGKKARMAYFIGVGVIMLSACQFAPMSDATLTIDVCRNNLALSHCLNTISENENICLWSTEEVMSETRRLNANIKLAYPRSVYVTTLVSVEYEDVTENMHYMENLIRNKVYDIDYIYMDKDEKQIIRTACEAGVNCVIVPEETLREDFALLLEECGFDNPIYSDGYAVFKMSLKLID